MENKETNYLIHTQWFIVFITLLWGFYALDARVDAINSRFDQYMIAMHEESKDFHGRLIQIQTEYKGHLIHQHK